MYEYRYNPRCLGKDDDLEGAYELLGLEDDAGEKEIKVQSGSVAARDPDYACP